MEYKYSAILYGCLDGLLFCTIKKTRLTGWIHLPSLVPYLKTVLSILG